MSPIWGSHEGQPEGPPGRPPGESRAGSAGPYAGGLIAILSELDLEGLRVGVQLYGTEPNRPFVDYLRANGAEPDSVAPYVYASGAETERVQALLCELEAGAVDVIAFTSRQ